MEGEVAMIPDSSKTAASIWRMGLGCLVLWAGGCSREQPVADVRSPQSPRVMTAEHLADPIEGDPIQFAVYTEESAPSDDTTRHEDICGDWPRPQLALLLTGRQHGYIEPCGCTGLDNAKGGLSRRHSLSRQLRDRGWDVIILDVGNQVRRFGKQAEIKFQTTIRSLRTMGYDAIGFGPDDLRLSIGELAAAVMGDGDGRGPFVCANVNVFGENKPYIVLERSGILVGITAILGTEQQREISSDEIEMTNPFEALERIVPEMMAKKCNLYVLLAHTSLEETRELSTEIPSVRSRGDGRRRRRADRGARNNQRQSCPSDSGRHEGDVRGGRGLVSEGVRPAAVRSSCSRRSVPGFAGDVGRVRSTRSSSNISASKGSAFDRSPIPPDPAPLWGTKSVESAIQRPTKSSRIRRTSTRPTRSRTPPSVLRFLVIMTPSVSVAT